MLAQVYGHVHALCMRQYWSTINVIIYWAMLTSVLSALVNNPVKKRFYGKNKKNN